ncbi:hypothetical protein TNIN_53321 [Trichonephila inaurata madagascariensis]|uniref:Uncharacterized protein n=1 Tax=Trichonephila inaurata madagascariensis TaxID=2747483 RepID=A0A8X6YPR8_9ARAC|nr:hypothetical protein TNIN_53321 [Trichonephila inaurata madagascariensis]
MKHKSMRLGSAPRKRGFRRELGCIRDRLNVMGKTFRCGLFFLRITQNVPQAKRLDCPIYSSPCPKSHKPMARIENFIAGVHRFTLYFHYGPACKMMLYIKVFSS